jgi:hypothetical protein
MSSELEAVTPAPPSAPETTPRKNGFQRLTGVLFAPVETFQEIAARPDIVFPLLVILVVSIITTAVAVPRMDFETTIREQMEQTNRNMSEADLDRVVRFSSAFARAIAYVSPVLNVAFFAIVAGIFLLAFRLFGGEGTYKQAFSVSLYAWVPLLILGIIGTIILLSRGGAVSADEMGTLVASHLGMLVDRKANPVLFALLSSIDIFTIWTLALFIIGFSFVSRFSRAKSAAVVLTLWAVMVIVKVGFAALGAARAAGA